MQRTLALLTLVLLVGAVPRPAAASGTGGAVLPTLPDKAEVTDADKETAREEYASVESAWGRSDLQGALRHADAAFLAVPNASTAILRATIFGALGQPCDAFAALLLAADLDPTTEERETIDTQLPKHGAACSPQMAWVAITVEPPDATVEVGGVTFAGRRTVGLPIGAYDVRVTASGHLPETASVQVFTPEGSAVSYRLRTEPAPAPAPAPAPVKESPPALGTESVVVTASGPADDGGSQLLPWLLVGGGGALIATGIGMHVWAIDAADQTSKYSRPVEGLTDDERKDRFDQANEDMELRGTLAYVFYGVGGAAAVAGSVLLILDATRDDSDAPVAVLPSAMPGGGGFLVRGEF